MSGQRLVNWQIGCPSCRTTLPFVSPQDKRIVACAKCSTRIDASTPAGDYYRVRCPSCHLWFPTSLESHGGHVTCRCGQQFLSFTPYARFVDNVHDAPAWQEAVGTAIILVIGLAIVCYFMTYPAHFWILVGAIVVFGILGAIAEQPVAAVVVLLLLILLCRGI